MKASWYLLFPLPLLSQKGACTFCLETPVFVAVTQGTSLDHLILVASRIYVHGFHRTKQMEKEFLTSCHPQGPAEWQQNKGLLRIPLGTLIDFNTSSTTGAIKK